MVAGAIIPPLQLRGNSILVFLPPAQCLTVHPHPYPYSVDGAREPLHKFPQKEPAPRGQQNINTEPEICCFTINLSSSISQPVLPTPDTIKQGRQRTPGVKHATYPDGIQVWFAPVLTNPFSCQNGKKNPGQQRDTCSSVWLLSHTHTHELALGKQCPFLHTFSLPPPLPSAAH